MVLGILFRHREVVEQIVNAPAGHATTLAKKTTWPNPTCEHMRDATFGGSLMEYGHFGPIGP
jgi:hypothetical protein